jgi:hypothetical protein
VPILGVIENLPIISKYGVSVQALFTIKEEGESLWQKCDMYSLLCVLVASIY